MSKKALVLFYSWSGNTRRIARIIAEKTGSDLRELQPETPYSQNYNTVLSQAKQEIQTKQYPSLRPIDMDWSVCDVIYLGTPNWWASIAPPVSSFMREIMPTDKTSLPSAPMAEAAKGISPVMYAPTASAVMFCPFCPSRRMAAHVQRHRWSSGSNIASHEKKNDFAPQHRPCYDNPSACVDGVFHHRAGSP